MCPTSLNFIEELISNLGTRNALYTRKENYKVVPEYFLSHEWCSYHEFN